MSCVLTHDALRRGKTRVLEPAEYRLPHGAVIGVIGANGAGKSTLFLALAGLLRRSSGTARVKTAGTAPRVCYMPQHPALPVWLSAREAIAMYSPTPIEAVTGALRLDALLDREVVTLSGGELQAITLAAVVSRPGEILVLDEPLAHLDFRRRVAAIELLRDHTSNRALTLISSQNAADLASFCTWYLVLAGGRAVFAGTLETLIGEDSLGSNNLLAALESRLTELLDSGAATALS